MNHPSDHDQKPVQIPSPLYFDCFGSVAKEKKGSDSPCPQCPHKGFVLLFLKVLVSIVSSINIFYFF